MAPAAATMRVSEEQTWPDNAQVEPAMLLAAVSMS